MKNIPIFIESHLSHDCETCATYGCFLKWWYPQNTPKWSFLVGKPIVVGYQHFRKPPYTYLLHLQPSTEKKTKAKKNKEFYAVSNPKDLMLRITNLYLSIPIEKATSHNLTINWKHANMTKTNLTLGRKLIWVKSKGTPPMPEVLGVALGGTANWCAPSATAPWFQWDTEGYNNYTYTYSPKNGVISMRSKTNMFIQRSLKNIGGIKLNVSIIHIHHSFCAFPRFLLRKESVILGLLFFFGGGLYPRNPIYHLAPRHTEMAVTTKALHR